MNWLIAGTDAHAKNYAVLIGGGKTFIAGADINMFVQMTSGRGGRINLLPTLLKMEYCSKPVVVAIHGNALGGGLEVAQACHYRVASPDAKVGQPETGSGKRGTISDMCACENGTNPSNPPIA